MNATTPTALVPVVHVKDGKVFANSRDVAAFFGKAHGEVLKDIRRITETLSREISPVWFQATTWEQKTGFGFRSMPAYDMTRDGFTLLVMGYTGKTAMDFKVRYIQQFNKMEEALRNPAPALPDFSNPAIAARAWADEVEKRQIVEERLPVKCSAPWPPSSSVQRPASAPLPAVSTAGRCPLSPPRSSRR